jgi:hypothetical protein
LNCFKEIAAPPRDHGRLMTPAMDLRGLDPPEPLLRILEALEHGSAGPHVFLLSQEPRLIYGVLADGGWRHSTREDPEGCELTVFRDPRDP